MVEALYSYLAFSITDTPVILRMTNGHPYGNRDLLCVWMACCRKARYVASAVPYGEVDLLRVWAALLGKVSGGASPSPTRDVAVKL